MITLISQSSMGVSKWVKREINFADRINLPILPVQIGALDIGTSKPWCLDEVQTKDVQGEPVERAVEIIVEVARKQLSLISDAPVATEKERDKEISSPKGATLQEILNARTRREPRLFDAVRAGVSDVEAVDSNGRTALHYAVSNAEADVMILLVEHGADINAQDKDGVSPLHLAIEDVALARWLLLKGANYGAKTAEGSTPLDYARERKATHSAQLLQLWADVKAGRAKPNDELAKYLLLPTHKASKILDAVAAGADNTTLRSQADRTALHYAAEGNESDLVSLLLERGADPKAADRLGNTPLMLAHQKGSTEAEEILRAWLAKKPAKTSASKAAKETPAIVEAELPAVQPNEQLQTALLGRGRFKADGIMRAIRGGATDFELRDQVERTALHWCAMKGDAQAAKIALEGGASIDAINVNGETPLDLAIENGSKEVAALLANAQLKSALSLGQGRSKGESKSARILRAIRGGATDFSLTDQAGRTALHWAAMKDDLQAAKLALENGADANAVSNAKQTPLDLAKANNAAKIVALLSAPAKTVASSTRPEKPTQPKTITPLPIADEVNSSATAANRHLQDMLMSKGPKKAKNVLDAIRGGATDFSLTDQSGRTALHWAAREDDVEAARIAIVGGVDISAESNLRKTAFDLAKENGAKKTEELLKDTPRVTMANYLLSKAIDSTGGSKARDILRAIRVGATRFTLTDYEGCTALHWAARENDVEAARMALANGADPDVRSDLGQTALELARASKSAEVVALLSSPAQITVSPTQTTSARGNADAPALHPENSGDERALTRKLYDVFISHVDEDSSQARELYEALQAENVSCWFDKVESANGNLRNYTMDIPRAVAASWSLVLLVSKAANRKRSGVTLECNIALRRDVGIPIYPVFIEDVAEADQSNLTYFLNWPDQHLFAFSHPAAQPIQSIARQIKARVVEEKGSDFSDREPKPPQLSAANQRLQKALKESTSNRARAVVRAIDEGATDFSGRDEAGRTALHWAVEANDLEAVQKALEAGADVNAADSNGQTPLGLADERKLLWVARELKKYDAK